MSWSATDRGAVALFVAMLVLLAVGLQYMSIGVVAAGWIVGLLSLALLTVPAPGRRQP